MSKSELFHHLQQTRQFNVRCLVPDLPEADALLPWLREIDANAWYSNFGPLLARYESALGELTGASALGGEGVALSSGTAALALGLRALELPPGSRVLLPAFTFAATLLAVREAGHVPVLTDVCPETWTLTPEMARALCARNAIDAVLPVATLGASLPIALWDAFVRDTGIPVLIDAAASLGWQTVGARVPIACSLHATKPLGIGEGGLFATADAAQAERVRRWSNFGFVKGVITTPGTNAKLSEYAAAVGLAQLARWKDLRQRREDLWAEYRAQTGSMPGLRLQLAPHAPAMLMAAFAMGAERVIAACAAAGIETRLWYLPPLTHHPAFAEVRRLGPDGGTRLPASESLQHSAVGLPFHSRLQREALAKVTAVLGSLD